MIITMIIVAEVGFWVLLAAGLTLRYALRRPRAGAAVLLCEPLLELVLLVTTTIDLRNGATASTKHGLAAVYIGYSVGFGHYTIAWVDRHVAHRFAGGPKPAKPPKYGRARIVHEWQMWLRMALAAGVAAGLLQLAIWYVDDADRTAALRDWQSPMGLVTGIWFLVALSYTLWPKKDPHGASVAAGPRVQQPLPPRPSDGRPEHLPVEAADWAPPTAGERATEQQPAPASDRTAGWQPAGRTTKRWGSDGR